MDYNEAIKANAKALGYNETTNTCADRIQHARSDSVHEESRLSRLQNTVLPEGGVDECWGSEAVDGDASADGETAR